MIRNLLTILKKKLLKLFKANKAEKKGKNTSRECKEALEILSGIFQDDEKCMYQESWKVFFLSDVFLKVQFEDAFADMLLRFIKSQTKYAVNELPGMFLTESAIAYALTPNNQGGIDTYMSVKAGSVIADLWNLQSEEWRMNEGLKVLKTRENERRIQAFSNYIFLRLLDANEGISEENRDKWSGAASKGIYTESHAKTLMGGTMNDECVLQLYMYWMLQEEMPDCLGEHIYRHYHLRNRTEWSKAVKEAAELPKFHWEYFFMYGFGLRHVKWNVPYAKDYIVNGEIYLPQYMDEGYRVFLQKDEHLKYGSRYEFSVSDGNRVSAEFYPHHIDFKRLIILPELSYDTFLKYVSVCEDAHEFFCLLAITDIPQKKKAEAKVLIKDWLKRTPLFQFSHEIISSCIVENNAEDRDMQEMGYIDTYENCLIIKKKSEYSVYRYTHTGIEPVLPWQRADFQDMDLDSVLKEYAKPAPTKIASFDVAGKTNAEKAQIIVEALRLHEKERLKGRFEVPYVPEKYPQLEELFQSQAGWLTDTYVVLRTEFPKNLIKEKILPLSIQDFGYNSNYYEEKEQRIYQETVDNLVSKVKRTKWTNCIMEGRVLVGESFRRTEPFLIGENGKIYFNYSFARLGEVDTFAEMLEKKEEFEHVIGVDVYAEKLSMSRNDGKLEYCFSEADFLKCMERLDQYEKAGIERPSELEQSKAEYYSIFFESRR